MATKFKMRSAIMVVETIMRYGRTGSAGSDGAIVSNI